MPASLLRRHLRFSTYDGLTAMPIVYLLTPGNFVMAALLAGLFQLPPQSYALIVAMPFFGNFLQVFLMPLVNRFFSAKAVSILAAWIQLICWGTAAVVIGFLPLDRPEVSGRWLLGFFVVSAGATALTAVGWTSWVQEWVPERIRGKYFGFRNRVLQVTTITFLVATGLIFRAHAQSVLAFQLVLGGAAVLRVFSCLAQQGIRAGAGRARREAVLPWREQLGVLGRTRSFLWFVAFGAMWGFAANCFGPFYPVFLYRVVNLTLSDLSVLTILASVGGALSYPAWGALADRFGNKPVIIFCMLAWQLQNYLWCFVAPGRENLLYAMWIFGGIMSAGLILGLFSIQLKIIPPAAKTMAISLNLAVTSLVTAVAPMIGGWVIDRFLTAGRDALSFYHTIFLVQPTLAILSCVLIARVHESAASPLASVVGAMRNIRTLTAVLGLGFLVNNVFYKARRDR